MGNQPLHALARQLHSRRIDRRRFLQGAAALGASATAISSALRATGARAQDGVKVTMWTTHVEPDLTSMRNIVEAFHGENPNVQAEVVQIPPAEVTDVSKLMTAVRGGTGPDIYFLDRFIVAQRAADGLLQDLSTYGAQDLMGNYLSFARAEASFNGQPYALPFDTDARALYYNRALLQSVGVDPAEFDAATGVLTWDRVKEVARQLDKADADGNYTQMGFVPWFNQGWHYTYGFSWGGEFFDQENCEVTLDDPNIVAAFQWVYDYAQEIDPQKAEAFAGPYDDPGAAPQENPFTVGRLAMMITGDWHIAQMRQYGPEIDYGITFIPVPNEGDQSSTWAGGWSVTIPQGAKEPEAAFEFMQYFAGEPGQRVYTKETAHIPTIAALLEDPSLYDERHLFFVEKLMPTANNRPPLPVGALYWDELTDAWQATYLNETEPEEALKQVKERVQAQLDQFC